jgi:serine/threonine-protein kinase
MEHEERLKVALADRYQIEREIGSGGMATVYLAHDLKHDRKVAVKVMRPELTADMGADRFLAEIRTTATLSHPHILPLHDSGEADGFLFYVMPYVEGESLRERLDRDGQLPVEEAVRIVGHVADALESAHRHGVIHRDLKPANILFQEGEPVVTDFGIALAVSAAGEGRLTETGLSLGTPYYMSPEQASGERHLPPASDVYSLGCVLYEMLTGDPPHMGSSPQAILGKILLGEVTRPTQLRPTIPANVEGAILRALERLPADRFESAAELGAALKDKSFRHGVGAGARPGPWRGLAIGFAAVAVLAVAALVTLSVRPGTPLPPASRDEIQLPGELDRFNFWGRYTEIAPDGSSMVYADTVGTGTELQYWVKDRGSMEVRPVTGTVGAYGATYSPDGAWIVYAVGTDLFKSPLQGAGQVPLLGGVRASYFDFHPLWLSDGTILLNLHGGALVRIPDDGGAPPDTVFAFPEDYITWVQGLPGREAVLVVGCRQTFCTGGTYLSVVDLTADTTWVLLEEVLRAWYTPTGHVVYVGNNGAVFAAPFDLDRLEMWGTHEPMFEGVFTYSGGMVMGQDGTVIYRELLGSAYNAHSGTSSRTFGQCPQTAGNTLCGPRTDGSCSTGAETALEVRFGSRNSRMARGCN